MLSRNLQKLSLYPGHFKLIIIFADELVIALQGVLFDCIYINFSNIINNLLIYRRKEGKNETEKEAYTGTYPNCSFVPKEVCICHV